MHRKAKGSRLHTHRCSILASHTHTLTQLNGSGGLIKPAVPPPARSTVLTFEKSRRISSQRRKGSTDFILTPKQPCPMRHNTITLTLIKRTLYMEMETGFSEGSRGAIVPIDIISPFQSVRAPSLPVCLCGSRLLLSLLMAAGIGKKKKYGSNVP